MRSIIFNIITCITVCLTSSCQQQVHSHSFIRFHLYGKGETVFVLSGGPGNNCMQEEDVAITIGKKYKAVLLEQRGTGLSMPPQSDKNSITMEAYLNDLLFIMDSLKISKAKFYGHSWGAMYASAFAVKYPERVTSLVLTGPGFLKMDPAYQNTIYNNRIAKLSPEQLKRFNSLALLDPKKMTAEQEDELDDLRATFNTYDSSNKAWKFARISKGETNRTTQNLLLQDLSRNQFDITEEIKSLTIPIHIITCKEDPLAFLTNEYKKFAPKAELYWMDHCGHFPMYEQPEKFYSLLMQALEK